MKHIVRVVNNSYRQFPAAKKDMKGIESGYGIYYYSKTGKEDPVTFCTIDTELSFDIPKEVILKVSVAPKYHAKGIRIVSDTEIQSKVPLKISIGNISKDPVVLKSGEVLFVVEAFLPTNIDVDPVLFHV